MNTPIPFFGKPLINTGVTVKGTYRGKEVSISDLHYANPQNPRIMQADMTCDWSGLTRRLGVPENSQYVTLNRNTNRPIRIIPAP